MLKNSKMGTLITGAVSIVTAVGLILLFVIANGNMSKAMKENALNNMKTSLNSQANVIEDYVEQGEVLLLEFAQDAVIQDMLRGVGSKTGGMKAQRYTLQFFEKLNDWEGVYIADWKSQVKTHPAEPVIGRVMREGDRLEALRNDMLSAPNGVLNYGMIISPASGQLTISMYVPIFDVDGVTPVGYAGGGTLGTGLKKKLDSLSIIGMENSKKYMLNVNTRTHIFNEDESLMGMEVEDELLLKVLDRIDTSEDLYGTLEYKNEQGEKCVGMYLYMEDRGWALLLEDTEKEIYGATLASQRNLGIACVFAYIIIVSLTYLLVKQNTKPLKQITDAIVKLQKLDLEPLTNINGYIGTKSEVGVIATAVDSLRSALVDIVQTLKSCTSSLDESSETMINESQNLMKYVTDNSATTEELAASITTTNGAISLMESKINDIIEMVSKVDMQVAEGSKQSNELMKSADQMSTMANESLENAKTNIKLNQEKVTAAMVELQALSQINQLATEILDITSQTNLLSLNASIEAARAGEAGKGFAVVASEIKSLADSSSKTAQDIQDICVQTNDNIEAVQKCFDDIIGFLEKDVSNQFQKFVVSAEEYNHTVEEFKKTIEEIHGVTSEFSVELNEIGEQVNHVRDAAENNEAGVNDIIEKNEQTNSVAEVLSDVVGVNQGNTEKLGEIVKEFIVD